MIERRKRPRSEAEATKEEARAVVHRLWTKEVGTQGYNKRDWRELRQLIFRLTRLEL